MTRGLSLGIRVTLTVLLVAATQTPLASGQCEYNHIFASDGDDHDNYGAAVALDDAVALIGAPSVQGAGVSSGAAYVVLREGLSWVDEQKLVPAGSLPLDLFGTSVALDGDVAVVGAPRTGLSRGSAFVFRYDGGAESWIEEQELAASDATDGNLFGDAVAIQGDLILVGAPSADDGAVLNAGAVYVYSYNGATWDEDQKLAAPNAVNNDSFGTSVALSGNLALIGDSGRDFRRPDQCRGGVRLPRKYRRVVPRRGTHRADAGPVRLLRECGRCVRRHAGRRRQPRGHVR